VGVWYCVERGRELGEIKEEEKSTELGLNFEEGSKGQVGIRKVDM